jgi:predicted transcriptional regulator
VQKLTNKEEEIMHILWKLEKAFVKDVLAEIKDDKPHYNTLSTIIRNLEEKGYVSYNAYGKTHQYFPVVSKESYKERFMNTAIESYFNNSYKNVVSFFAKEEKISVDELKEIIALIENKK